MITKFKTLAGDTIEVNPSDINYAKVGAAQVLNENFFSLEPLKDVRRECVVLVMQDGETHLLQLDQWGKLQKCDWS